MPSNRLSLWQVFYKYSLYEAGESAWSLIVVSIYFGTFVQVVLKHPGAHFGWAVTLGALIIAVVSPLLGASVDTSGRRQPFLRIFVIAAAICTAMLSWVTTVESALLFFVLAYICVYIGFTFFLAMIPAVSHEGNVGKVFSMTVGVGYLGGLVSLLTLSRFVPNDEHAGAVFLPIALIYLACAFPAMFLAPDFPKRRSARPNLAEAYRRIRETIRGARQHKFLFRFLIGDFLYENAIASVITLMGLYSRNVMGFTAGELTGLFGPSIVVAMLSAWFVFGPLVRAIGPKKTVIIDLVIWLLLFAMVFIVTPGTTLDAGTFHLNTKQLFSVVVAPLAGLGLAGAWTSSRVFLTALTPVHHSGEIWGLYNLSGRTASVLGDATWALVLTLLGEQIFGYQMAVIALAIYVVLGLILIVSLPDARPSSENFLKGEGFPNRGELSS